jgi:hypothetical protein
MASETDQIREQIDETRNSLKLHMGQLEEQVMGTVNHTKDTVTDTIDSIKSGIEKVSPAYQFQEHPIVFAVGAVIAGLAAGKVIGGVLTPRYDRPRLVKTQPAPQAEPAHYTASSPSPVSSQWNLLREVAMGAFLQVAGEIAKTAFPKHEGVVGQIVQDFRTKLETSH